MRIRDVQVLMQVMHNLLGVLSVGFNVDAAAPNPLQLQCLPETPATAVFAKQKRAVVVPSWRLGAARKVTVNVRPF